MTASEVFLYFMFVFAVMALFTVIAPFLPVML